MNTPIWQPSQDKIESSNLVRFMDWLEETQGLPHRDYDSLYKFSIEEPEAFWLLLKDFCAIKAETWGDTALENPDALPGASFFPGARLNFAENLLNRVDTTDAIVFWGEDKVKRHLSHADLQEQVSKAARALIKLGLQPGDRVGAVMPNMPETIIAMLAVVSLGGVWSSCSPDFGKQGILDRFGQIEPKILIAVEGYYYNGKEIDCLNKIQAVMADLPTVCSTLIIPYVRDTPDLAQIKNAHLWTSLLDGEEPGPIAFAQMPFNHPLYIMFSSGTTGVPKCIVHGAGGTLLKHLSEHFLHADIKPGDRLFYFTTCGWMMWNWMVSGLSVGATLLLYDGSPFYPDGNILFDYADAEKMTFFGTSAKFIDAVNKAGLKPKKTHDLSSVRTIASTGSPLVAEAFDFVYRDVKTDVHLASISGGTDIIGCFVLGNPIKPVWRGEIQGPALGLAVDVFDDDGRPVKGEKGELVCTNAFPSMPIGFWHDDDGSRYRDAYFNRFPDTWCHGDYVAWTDHGGMVIYGRSDATLNPGGVRIGTAEIYRQVEKLEEVQEAIVVGQDWLGDVRVILFVILQNSHQLDDDLILKIKTQIKTGCTPRHVPAKVIAVRDIPRTKSGKITELAVRDVIHGRVVKNVEALANPEALEHFKNLLELTD